MNRAQTFLISYIAPALGLVLVFAITSLIIPIVYLVPIYGLAFLLMYFIHRVEKKENEVINTNSDIRDDELTPDYWPINTQGVIDISKRNDGEEHYHSNKEDTASWWSDIDYSKLQEDANIEEPPEEYFEKMYESNYNDSFDDSDLQDLEEELNDHKERILEMEQYIAELESEVERLQSNSDDY